MCERERVGERERAREGESERGRERESKRGREREREREMLHRSLGLITKWTEILSIFNEVSETKFLGLHMHDSHCIKKIIFKKKKGKVNISFLLKIHLYFQQC